MASTSAVQHPLDTFTSSDLDRLENQAWWQAARAYAHARSVDTDHQDMPAVDRSMLRSMLEAEARAAEAYRLSIVDYRTRTGR